MSESDGFVVGIDKIVDHGPDSERWNLVVIGDGYRESELIQKYQPAVDNFVSTLSLTPPFNELFFGINIYRLDVASDESGADDPNVSPDVMVNTFFDARFWLSIPRVLTINDALARSVTTTQVPDRHQVLCIVNTSNYGGSGIVGGGVAVCSTHSASALIAIHEMGHSAFGLADEYGGGAVHIEEPPNPNITLETNIARNKWNALIPPGTPMPTQCNPGCMESTCVAPAQPPLGNPVGTYEGGGNSSCNVYRPVFQCKMAANSAPFCPVCSGVIRATLQPFLP
jgi:hypothetical protein